MLHCPYCSGIVKEQEIFCTQCGKKLPHDIDQRNKKKMNRIWYLPLFVLFFILLTIGAYYLHLEKKEELARELYKRGENHALNGQYQQAIDSFSMAIQHKGAFPTAKANLSFLETAIYIDQQLQQAEQLLKNKQYQQALQLLNQAETSLNNYEGEVVNLLLESILEQRQTTQLVQLRENFESNPTIDELKTLLWVAETIGVEEADEVANSIRKQIVAIVFSSASQQLANKNFNSARDIIEDGLQYAPHSEKLISLKTTIEKEKTAFEIAQQKRIEQAINAAQEEKEKNKNDAVQLLDVQAQKDEQNNLVVSGKIKSVATVPINTISVEYILLAEKDNSLLDNEVYIYPETLYPEEEGQFEYTHFDLKKEIGNVKVKIQKIKWFLD